MQTVVNETPQQMIARLQAELASKETAIAESNRRIAELETAKAQLNVTWKFAEYGKGAVSVYGIGGRFPIAMYPPTLVAFVSEYGPRLVAFASDPKTINESRARGYAYEAADLAFKAGTGRDYIHDERSGSAKRSTGDEESWRKLYDASQRMALADVSLTSKALAKRNAK